MLQKRMFKVLAPIARKDGGTYWMRVGSGFTNKDESINLYLDAITREMKFQLRELTEEDLKPHNGARTLNPPIPDAVAASASTDIPF